MDMPARAVAGGEYVMVSAGVVMSWLKEALDEARSEGWTQSASNVLGSWKVRRERPPGTYCGDRLVGHEDCGLRHGCVRLRTVRARVEVSQLGAGTRPL